MEVHQLDDGHMDAVSSESSSAECAPANSILVERTKHRHLDKVNRREAKHIEIVAPLTLGDRELSGQKQERWLSVNSAERCVAISWQEYALKRSNCKSLTYSSGCTALC